MESTNVGIINAIISKKLKDSYFGDVNQINESKNFAYGFLDIIKKSPILELEFKVFDNLENKHIKNELSASRYIDNNIKLFEIYTLEELDKEHEKLNTFLLEGIVVEDDKLKLYNAINTLIRESLNDYDKIDVDAVHESFILVANHMMTPKKELIESEAQTELIEEEVIEIAVDRFNKKYGETLTEDDKKLLTKLVNTNNIEKRELLETYRKETLEILESVNKDRIEDKVARTIQKIREMTFKSDTASDDIISLHELKKGLL